MTKHLVENTSLGLVIDQTLLYAYIYLRTPLATIVQLSKKFQLIPSWLHKFHRSYADMKRSNKDGIVNRQIILVSEIQIV